MAEGARAHLRWEQPQRAVEARRDTGQDDARVALEALRTAVHHRLDGLLLGRAVVVVLQKPTHHPVDPAARLRALIALF